jgi:cysteine-rich repeat protein
MITMDVSSSMLQGGSESGATKWDKARFALSGNPRAPNPGDQGYVEPVLTRKVRVHDRDIAIEDIVHLGMVAFAGPDEQQQLFGFGPCMRDNIAWAMDPQTSCVAPGCSDPYGRAPHAWTYKDSDKDRDPHFVRRTHSYMPACDRAASDGTCEGSSAATFTGQGLQFARERIRAYRSDSEPFPQNNDTRYVNILITDGRTSEGSSDVQAALRGLLDDGVKTYVIGFGTDDELDRAQLDQYASWGDTRQAIVVDPGRAQSADMLANALTGIVSSLGLDACCVLNQCAIEPEPADPHAVCGDGKVEGNEVCDDGELNSSYGHCNASCQGKHLFCGDKRMDGPEECDDGNQQEHDGCTSDCRLLPDELDAGPDMKETQSRVGAVPPGVGRAATAASGAVSRTTLPAPGQALANAAGAGAAPASERRNDSNDGGCGCHVLGNAARGSSRGMLILAFCAAVLLRPGLRMRVRRRRT